jgi:hypothetical protein
MIVRRLAATLAGRSMWLRLKRKYDVDDGVYVLLMPEDDEELNEQALSHIDDLVRHRRARGVVILTDNAHIKTNARAYSAKILDVCPCSPAQADKLLAFYEFYNFLERLLVVSTTKPFGRGLYKAQGVNGITKEDLVCLGILLIRDWSDGVCSG